MKERLSLRSDSNIRIITKFKDYYDSAAAFGLDANIIYFRETKEVGSKKKGYVDRSVYFDSKTYTRYEYRSGKIGFCGKFYCFIVVHYWDRKENCVPNQVFWSFEDFDQWFSKARPDWKKGHNKHCNSWDYTKFKKCFDESPDSDDVFHEHDTPVICFYNDDTIVLNPKLSDFEFYHVFDSYQAHQEIAMYVGGILDQPENNMIEISDDIRIAKHGFDQFSFRADKGSGPKRKRKK